MKSGTMYIIPSMDKYDIDKLIGHNLKRLRMERMLSQTNLAEMTGCAKTKISALETGHEGMGKELLARFCSALEVTPDQFYVNNKQPVTPYDISPDERAIINTLRNCNPDDAEMVNALIQRLAPVTSHSKKKNRKRA